MIYDLNLHNFYSSSCMYMYIVYLPTKPVKVTTGNNFKHVCIHVVFTYVYIHELEGQVQVHITHMTAWERARCNS